MLDTLRLGGFVPERRCLCFLCWGVVGEAITSLMLTSPEYPDPSSEPSDSTSGAALFSARGVALTTRGVWGGSGVSELDILDGNLECLLFSVFLSLFAARFLRIE